MQKLFELTIPEGIDTLASLTTEFNSRLALDRELIVEVPLPSVGSTNSYLDLVEDFADASFICERLGACATGRAMRWSKSGYVHAIHLELTGYFPGVMALELAWMAILMDWPNCEAESLRDLYDQIREATFDHADNIQDAHLLFPEIADHYLGNLVMGAYHEWEGTELLRAELQLHPERRYGFFISRSLSQDGLPVLSSDGQIVVPLDASLEKVLEAAGYEGEKLLPAKLVMTEREASFIAQHDVVGVRAEDVINAIACGDDFVRRIQLDPDSSDLLSFTGRPAGKPSAYVGELSGCAMLQCTGFTILFLNADPVDGWARAAQADQLRSLAVSLHDGGSPHPVVDLKWEPPLSG